MRTSTFWAPIFGVLLGINLISNVSTTAAFVGDFNRDFYITWGSNHVNTTANGLERSLTLDQLSGSGFASKDNFLFAEIDMDIKLILGNSVGIIVAFYLTSNSPNRDELDFEFLGNLHGQPILVQTNVFVNGFGDREQRIRLWFDPAADFHTYTIRWNAHQIVFLVDWVPIRTYTNYEGKGLQFPRRQTMGIEASIWNATWATGGAQVDWSQGSYTAFFRNYKRQSGTFGSLTGEQRKLLRWVRQKFMVYDYCQDKQRFHKKLPKECYLSQEQKFRKISRAVEVWE